MKLLNKYSGTKYESMNEFFCDITSELDILAGIVGYADAHIMRHYVLANDYTIKNRILAIRIPGGTVGGIWIDDNNTITKIVVDEKCIVKTYPPNINVMLEKYIGESMEINKYEIGEKCSFVSQK